MGNNGSGQVARSFLNFNAGLFKGRQIVSSTLSLFESWSYNCTAKSFSSWDAGLASTATRWTAQPTIGVKRASKSAAVGYSASCPAARVQIDMTAQAQGWSTTSGSQVGMMLRADDEADVVAWKRFHSSEGAWKPVISVTFDRAPEVPGIPWLEGLTSADTAAGEGLFIGTTTPVVSVPVEDVDGDPVTAVFKWFTTASGLTPEAELCRATAASGGTAECVTSEDAGVPPNATVWIRATAYDGRVWSGWGPALEVRTATAAPLPPTIACTSPDGSWATVVAAAESCTITARFDPANAVSAPTSVEYSVDGGEPSEVSFTQITTDTVAATVTVGGTAGVHRVEASALSPVGVASASASYGFGYGGPSLTAPLETVTTHGAVTVTGAGAPKGGATEVTGAVQWRLQGTTTWQDTAATVTPGVSESTLSGSFDTDTVLTADPTLKRRPSVVVELRGKFVYDTIPAYTDTVQVVRVPHAFGAGFPVTDVTGGQVALWTGELQASVVDAEVATPGGGL